MSGHAIVDGKPYINGKPAVWHEEPPLLECFSQWHCPECGAALDADTLICLNACHLSAAAYRRLQSGLYEAARRVKQRKP